MSPNDLRTQLAGGLFSLLLCAWMVPMDRANADESQPKLQTFRSSQGETYFSLSISDPIRDAEPKAIDLALVLDLSASQSGQAFQQTVSLAKRVTANLAGGSRVHVLLSNRLDTHALGNPSAVGSEELARLLNKVAASSPIGASNLPSVFQEVQQWLGDPSSNLPKRILVIGDGQSTDSALDADRLQHWIEQLSSSRTPLSFVAVGAEATWLPLRSVAVRTGGRVWSAASDPAKLATEILSGLMHAPLHVTSFEMKPNPKAWFPTVLPPLRGDTQTLVVGRIGETEKLQIRLSGSRDGEPAEAQWTVRAEPIQDDGSYLADLVQRWEQTPNLPSLHDARTTISQTRELTALRSQAIAAQAKAALSQRRLDDAKALYETVLAWHPGDIEASVGLRAVERLRAGNDPRVANRSNSTGSGAAPDNPVRPTESNTQAPTPVSSEEATKEPVSDPIEDAKARAAILKQQMIANVTQALEESRRLARRDTEQAIQRLKRTLQSLLAAELEDDTKARLRQRIETQLRVLHRERSRSLRESLDTSSAGLRLRERTVRMRFETTRQEQLRQLLAQYGALMEQGAFAQAETVAAEALANDPQSVATAAAVLNSQLAHRYDQIEDVENRKERGWWEALYAVEASTIPIPDSTPMVFPPAREWEAMTLRREKYKVVHLSPVSPAEEKIRKALTRPISFDFRDTPLSDVVSFLRDFSDINIVLDLRGLDEAGVDPEELITLQLENVPLKSALNLLFRPLDLAYLVRDDVLLITSRLTADTQLVTKVYPVADLVVPIQNFNQGGFGTNGFNVGGDTQGNGQGLQGGGGVGLGGFGGRGPAPGGQGAGPRPRRGESDALRAVLDQVLDDRVNASLPNHGDPTATGDVWQRHFAQNAESERSLRAGVQRLVAANRHDAVLEMLSAAMRNMTVTPWIVQSFSLSAQIHGLDDSAIAASILSSVDLQPDDLTTRLRAAESLAIAGQGRVAVRMLQDWSRTSLDSVNLFFLALKLAGETGDVDSATWAADQLLSREWPASGDDIHDRTREWTLRIAELLHSEGRTQDAERLRSVVASSQRRDLEITIRWEGEADIDLAVVEPGNFLCSALSPQTVVGGVLVTHDVGQIERYRAAEAFSGDYEIHLTPVWGQPVGGIVNVDIARHRGSEQEIRERHTVKLGHSPAPIRVQLEDGRRSEIAVPAIDSKLVVGTTHAGTDNPRRELRRMIQAGEIALDPNPPPLLPGGAIGFGRSVPFVGAVGTVGGGAVAFDPVVEVLQDGLSLQAQAVVSADRRYVRLTLVPLLQNIQSIADVRTIQVGGTAGGGGIGVPAP